MRILSEEMDKKIEKWGLTEAEKRAILSRVRGSTDMSHAAEVGLVIEATPENLELKGDLLARKEISAIEKSISAVRSDPGRCPKSSWRSA